MRLVGGSSHPRCFLCCPSPLHLCAPSLPCCQSAGVQVIRRCTGIPAGHKCGRAGRQPCCHHVRICPAPDASGAACECLGCSRRALAMQRPWVAVRCHTARGRPTAAYRMSVCELHAAACRGLLCLPTVLCVTRSALLCPLCRSACRARPRWSLCWAWTAAHWPAAYWAGPPSPTRWVQRRQLWLAGNVVLSPARCACRAAPHGATGLSQQHVSAHDLDPSLQLVGRCADVARELADAEAGASLMVSR